jgi:hypothetical protein
MLLPVGLVAMALRQASALWLDAQKTICLVIGPNFHTLTICRLGKAQISRAFFGGRKMWC